MPPVMPTLAPPQNFKEIQNQRELAMMRQVALTKGGALLKHRNRRTIKGGATFVVPQTTNEASNENIVNTAKLMTRMDKLTQAQTKGGRPKKKNKNKKKKTRKYIRLNYVYVKPNT